ncbi:MAG: GrpB family protein [Rickettsiaceae bacterium]|nr:MAG: GrpB family protein [Rickettsiaceae bacterium]
MQIVPYNNNWPQLFDEELLKIKQALAKNYIEAYHIGSTSIPGLASKNVIDILCVVGNLKSNYSELCKLGYLDKGEYNIPSRLFFSKKNEMIQYNLHITEHNHDFISLNLHLEII